MTIFGIDMSDNDLRRGPTSAKRIMADGIIFASFKATEVATNGIWSHYTQKLTEFKDEGMRYLGAYMVPRTGVRVADSVDFYLNHLDKTIPWWRTFPGFFHQIDTEIWSQDGEVYDSVPMPIGEATCDLIHQLSGRKGNILHYASVGQYGSAWPSKYPRWNANYWLYQQVGGYRNLYNESGGDNGPGWTGQAKIWQYSDSAVIGGQNPCDANAFKGTEGEFATMINATSTKPTGGGFITGATF